MKYSKIVKDNLQNKSLYMGTILLSVIFFILLCFGSISLNFVSTWISGGTNVEDAEFNVIYYANMPDGVFSAIKFKIYATRSEHIIPDNSFGVPKGYEFVGWNNEEDGSGTSYKPGDVLNLKSNYVLYAQWREVLPEDNDNPNEGGDSSGEEPGTGGNDEIGEEDKPETGTEGEGDAPNGDVNGDGDNSNEGNGDNSGTDDDSTGENDESTNVGSGEGNSGGSGGSGNNNSSGGNTGSSNDSNNKKPAKPNNNPNNNLVVEEDRVIIPDYQFKFYDKNVMFSTTSCKVLEDGTCMLELPYGKPKREGYSFVGWSESTLCDGNIITETVKVDGNKNYYACYEINDESKKENNNIIYYILAIWGISGVLIYFVIKKYKKNRINIDND